jgi:hypothetical protein
MPRRRRPQSQTWRAFLANHVGQVMAADFFVGPTVTYRLLFVLVLLAHGRRPVVHVGVTEHPTSAWTAQQLRNAFPDDACPLPATRSRCRVRRSRHYDRHNGDLRHRHYATVALAQRLRQAFHGIHSPRVPRPRDRFECRRTKVAGHRVHRVRHALEDPVLSDNSVKSSTAAYAAR